jgi:hypothetical protein
MDVGLLFANLLSAPVLFFVLGMVACLVKSDLDVPQPIPKLLSLYLLISIGLKGGVELAQAEASWGVFAGLGAGVAMSFIVPIWTFALLKKRLGVADAAGIAATYGSISAVTFIIAASFLDSRGQSYGGHMVAAMALMESPAIIMGILLASRFADRDATGQRKKVRWGRLLHESAFNSAVLLLLGSMIIGTLIGKEGFADIRPFVYDPFKGVLCLFLLDMGLVAARRLGDLKRAGPLTVIFGLAAPPIHAGLGISLGYILNLSPGDTLLLAVLVGSASYIAVPAALRLSLPKANPSLYVPMSLGLTFPFNVVLGIPLYWAVIAWAWGL